MATLNLVIFKYKYNLFHVVPSEWEIPSKLPPPKKNFLFSSENKMKAIEMKNRSRQLSIYMFSHQDVGITFNRNEGPNKEHLDVNFRSSRKGFDPSENSQINNPRPRYISITNQIKLRQRNHSITSF